MGSNGRAPAYRVSVGGGAQVGAEGRDDRHVES